MLIQKKGDNKKNKIDEKIEAFPWKNTHLNN